MDYPFLVEVVYRTQYLRHDVGNVALCEMFRSLHGLEELPSVAILSDHVKGVSVLNHVIELDDVWVIYLPQNLKLGEQGLLPSFLCQALLLNDFDGSLLLGHLVVPLVDEPEPAFPYFIGVNVLLVHILLADSDEHLSVYFIVL